MISLKSYLSRDGRESENAYLHIIDLMLQGLVAHAVQGESSDYERFRAGVDRFTKTLTANVKPADLVATAGELVRTWEEYDRSTTAFIQRENCELHNMVSMLTQTIIKVGANDDTSAAKLREIEKGLEQAKIFKDVQLLKTRLSECLETVQEELARQKADSQNAMAALEQELERSCQRADMLAQQKQRDPVTGLLSRNEAEKAIQRFGYAVGDHVLSTCARHYRAGLSASDELYRWRGPAFLGILSRHARIDQVRGEIRQFASAKLEDAVDLGDRVVLIPVSSNWSVMPFTAPPESLLKKVAAFTAAQVSRDYV